MIVDDWIEQAWSLGASDLHLEAGTPLVARVRGDLQTVGAVVTGETLIKAAQDFLGAEGWAQFMERGSADLSVAIGGVRCRVNIYQTVRGVAAAIRLLAPGIKDLHGCNLHPDFRKLIEATTGLIIISGPTGSGASQRGASFRQSIPPLPAASVQSKSVPAKPGQTRTAQSKPGPALAAPADDVFEVPAEEMDLAQLAELAKKVVERKP